MSTTHVLPSYKQGYARGPNESAFPEMWRGLVGAWIPILGSSGGDIRDVSGMGNHGALTNMALSTRWIVGGNPRLPGLSLDFDGSDDVVSTGNTGIDALSKITICAVVYQRTDGGAGFGRLVYKANWFQITNIDDGNNLQFEAPGWATTGKWTFPFTMNEWTHYVVTYDYGSTANDPVVYKNGSSITVTETQAPAGSLGSDGSTFLIGGRTDFARAWDGQILSFKLHNVIFNQQDVSRDYANPVGSFRLRERIYGKAAAAAARPKTLIAMLHQRRFAQVP